jgi:rod shape-determining protein MreC
VIVLVLLSLALITVYFRESNGGELHSIQSTGATILRPFEVGAERVARPFRDAYGYTSGLVHAKSENAKLQRQVESLRQQVIQNESAAAENTQLKALLGYREGATFPNDFDAVAARVIARPPSIYEQQVVIAAGSRAGIRLHDSVVTGEGLVGQVTDVTSSTAKVTLLTDETSAVSAVDIHSHASGLVRHGAGAGGALILDRVTKDQVVGAGDSVVTAGWRLGKLSSIYPGGIPIGRVTSVGQTDTDLYKQIQVSPYVDFGSLDSVLVLVPKQGRAGRG